MIYVCLGQNLFNLKGLLVWFVNIVPVGVFHNFLDVALRQRLSQENYLMVQFKIDCDVLDTAASQAPGCPNKSQAGA